MQHAEELEKLGKEIVEVSTFLDRAADELSRRIVGQKEVIRRLFIAMLSNGHVLLEGVPGLAKTLMVKTLAAAVNLTFQRIQFTPDMLPADLIGTMIYNPKDMEFSPHRGPVFANVILADEINRTPAKVQSALLEAMQERQVTIGSYTFPLPEPFLVLATQNPIEHEGTYLLPEAQLDRFMMKVMVEYPSYDEELEIMQQATVSMKVPSISAVVQPEEIVRARSLIDRIYVDPRVQRYIVDLVVTTRDPARHGLTQLEQMIEYGASPRASIFLLLAAKAHAFLNHRAYITPEDVKAIAYDTLRHRLRPSYEAEADNVRPDDLIRQILQHVQVP
ncbi:AAA family ATPase [Chlorobium phaeobacteroides]|jgi:MoxR-like ATPase|uniref:ATPase associated with various cellular activities, AAA_3 n=1 Tax=Chlorobium phaeobacteroides (strain DSM 266 / SMG 266 / 2430) TaxID=290317 RepID=A1BJ66_CHLPD|nr:MoxR family ATPase [Chlorobium phaeobacteroides]ABL66443.1 ATPase associated with various cellular activities, AAA_3 [Chlorobium phaeobacteroides DSM 266]MBV5319529.1 MoxR family ATPase [Chlorobium phaeobacteroides]